MFGLVAINFAHVVAAAAVALCPRGLETDITSNVMLVILFTSSISNRGGERKKTCLRSKNLEVVGSNPAGFNLLSIWALCL